MHPGVIRVDLNLHASGNRRRCIAFDASDLEHPELRERITRMVVDALVRERERDKDAQHSERVLSHLKYECVREFGPRFDAALQRAEDAAR